MKVTLKNKFLWLSDDLGLSVKVTPELSLNDEQARFVCSFLAKLHPVFHENGDDKIELDSIYQVFKPSPEQFSEQVILFAGSFSPWHEGHRACVTGSTRGPIVIIPDYNPWKEVRQNSVWHELKTLWQFSLEHEGRSLYPGFLAKQEKNPTVSWLPELKSQSKWLLMGDDSFLNISKWKQAETLLSSLCGILVCPRLGAKSELIKESENLEHLYKLQVEFLAEHDYQGLSSTQLRDQN